MIVLSIIAVEVRVRTEMRRFPSRLTIDARQIYHTGIPVYALLISIAIPAVYYIPGGFVYALTGQSVRHFAPFKSRH